ncbi:O-acetylhomoserine aminocarboxypropyltransferase/cysteine synthase family protein [Clostridium intestinale]|uniref:homocysteine desulfhydrase n=1 Tax=Clostridium intestinale DSM 6191 TaxID=1121320 RepID=A0A1M5ZYR5_9CLOT|nr:aminotransferase class I/II-fold pyridoxal phosphate-dependent enzyme [Clostridium intestinale]SHI29417.1 O-acetylhomoserine (thiol)-lyase [Clostridium intestinale DSM 6191]
MKFTTKLIHGNEALDSTGATNTPVFLSNAYAHTSPEKLEGIFKGTAMGFAYTRISNPTINAFERRIASVEGAMAATAAASGMSAIYLAIMNIVESGDEIISSSGLFGGTYTLFRNLKSYGIKTNFLETLDEECLEKVVTEKTKVLFAEAIGNPKLDILDIEKVSEFCNKHNIIFIVDSTITTPYLINPIKYGADVVIHSTSKYINGTSNSIGGVIVDGGSTKYKSEKFENFSNYSKKFGKMAFTGKLRDTIGKDLGAALSPMSAFLNLTGIETLSLRMKQHCENTLKVAEYLEAHEKVVSINYPKLKSSPYFDLVEKYYEKGASGILTFRLGSKERCFKFINALKLIVNLSNVGDTKTLIIHPASTICLNNTEEEKLQMGVYEDLIRLSVGIEDIEDIIGDIEEALKAI